MALGTAITWPLAFFTIAELNLRRGADAWPRGPWDDLVPLVPAAVWFYVSWYLSPAVLFLLRGDAFRRAWCATLGAFAACCVGFLAFPARMMRPPLDAAAGDAGTRLLAFVYAMDPPVNVFPSLHVAVAVVIAASMRASRGAARVVVPVWMAAVCVACVLTKQHYLADVVAGALVGAAARVLAGAAPDLDVRADLAA